MFILKTCNQLIKVSRMGQRKTANEKLKLYSGEDQVNGRNEQLIAWSKEYSNINLLLLIDNLNPNQNTA